MLDPLDPLDDGSALRRTYGCFPTGVAAVCGLRDGAPDGMAASSFTAVSLDPPLVSVCVQDTSSTWPRLRRLPRLGISVLAETHDRACAALSRKEGDRFDGVAWDATADGAVFVDGSAAWLDCVVHDELPAGDHTIVLLRILGTRTELDTPPLVFHGSRFRLLAAG
ncbi:flavin reductase family protein [Pseudonocardia sp. NPDC049154]|uniref:flavin reductase family protein n=1 Tax=Pseudonocardia sp. NPDC049154 TaxID=3155501 RepID=UPI0033C895A7